MRPMRLWTAVAALGVLIALAGCATSRVYAEPPSPLPSPTETLTHGTPYADAPASPGAFVVRYGATRLRLEPLTYCFRNGCVDGAEDEHPPSVGSPAEILVFVPQAGFDTLQATQRTEGDACTARSVDALVAEVGDGWWSVRPQGPAGAYRVDLFASGDGAGDMVATVRWTTPADRPLPDPVATLALVVDHDGEPDSYGVELAVQNLPTAPDDVSATITVTASNGRSSTFPATRADCYGEGSLFFDGPDAAGTRAAALGDFPFAYTVELTIDGTTYTGTATYPDDLPGPTEVAVPLVFTPALP